MLHCSREAVFVVFVIATIFDRVSECSGAVLSVLHHPLISLLRVTEFQPPGAAGRGEQAAPQSYPLLVPTTEHISFKVTPDCSTFRVVPREYWCSSRSDPVQCARVHERDSCSCEKEREQNQMDRGREGESEMPRLMRSKQTINALLHGQHTTQTNKQLHTAKIGEQHGEFLAKRVRLESTPFA